MCSSQWPETPLSLADHKEKLRRFPQTLAPQFVSKAQEGSDVLGAKHVVTGRGTPEPPSPQP